METDGSGVGEAPAAFLSPAEELGFSACLAGWPNRHHACCSRCSLNVALARRQRGLPACTRRLWKWQS